MNEVMSGLCCVGHICLLRLKDRIELHIYCKIQGDRGEDKRRKIEGLGPGYSRRAVLILEIDNICLL